MDEQAAVMMRMLMMFFLFVVISVLFLLLLSISFAIVFFWKCLIGHVERHCELMRNSADVDPPIRPRQDEDDDGKKALSQLLRFLLFLDDLNLPRKNLDIDSAVDLFLLCEKNPLVYSLLNRVSPKYSHSDSTVNTPVPKKGVSNDKMAAADSTSTTPATTPAAGMPC
ncbi:uncharacterized protein BDCG_01174 [Blastomyces dermatitidis ER-3]|uniref:Uncharacterized protein n=2 Tax=Ajellomyces dermatitidis TaxID=5039 RepID=F2TMZ3_AJEDA|nr:uncharacterized protein BDCG_01174 [Blastomyces dermatitidis ER-3]EEQ84369.2 hypothetical protein BDCG_01174 [Blastomyces dermatitidis ER-3]EGE84606.1 hypothetical protein BDDG_07551 [Blastomyces dermatitidis ATCC 18188]